MISYKMKKLNAEVYVPHDWFTMILIDEIELQNNKKNNKKLQNWKFTQVFEMILCPDFDLENISKENQPLIKFRYFTAEFDEMVHYPHCDNFKNCYNQNSKNY